MKKLYVVQVLHGYTDKETNIHYIECQLSSYPDNDFRTFHLILQFDQDKKSIIVNLSEVNSTHFSEFNARNVRHASEQLKKLEEDFKREGIDPKTMRPNSLREEQSLTPAREPGYDLRVYANTQKVREKLQEARLNKVLNVNRNIEGFFTVDGPSPSPADSSEASSPPQQCNVSPISAKIDNIESAMRQILELNSEEDEEGMLNTICIVTFPVASSYKWAEWLFVDCSQLFSGEKRYFYEPMLAKRIFDLSDEIIQQCYPSNQYNRVP